MKNVTNKILYYDLIDEKLFAEELDDGYFLCFRRGEKEWQKRGVKQFFVNRFYFVYLDESACLFSFSPSILMKEETLGFRFLKRYFISKNQNEKDEMILSSVSFLSETIIIRRTYTYSIIHNDDFLILGIDGYRKIISRTDMMLEDEITISQQNLFETEIVNQEALLLKPIKQDLFLVRAQNSLERNFYEFPNM
ncbi:MAG: hypothetical protein ACK5N8_00790 [Alphaproteobacteria bacterium]